MTPMFKINVHVLGRENKVGKNNPVLRAGKKKEKTKRQRKGTHKLEQTIYYDKL